MKDLLKELKPKLVELYDRNEMNNLYVIDFAINHSKYSKILKQYGVNLKKLKSKLIPHIDAYKLAKTPVRMTEFEYLQHKHGDYRESRGFVRVLDASIKNQELLTKNKSSEPSFELFVLTLLHEADRDDITAYELQESGIDIEKLKADVQRETKGKESLEELCLNLNEQVESGKIDQVIGRDKEVLEVVTILGKRKKSNPVLLGKAGVGKTAIAEGLAYQIVKGNVPHTLKNGVVYSLQVANLTAGTKYRGEFEEKIMNLLKTLVEITEKGDEFPILFIDEIHSIVGAGNNNGNDLSNILKPFLAKGSVSVLGATTDEEWRKFINQEKALKRRFTSINVDEPSLQDTFEILKGSLPYYEKKHKLKYNEESLWRCIHLAEEFVNNTCRPDKALDLMDYAGAMFRIRKNKKLDSENMEEALSLRANIPLEKIRDKKQEKEEYTPLAPKIKKELFGQDHAVDLVVEKLEESFAGLSEGDKPLGAFLLIGPTGVGKTELAKQIAKHTNAELHRFDMSEYMEKHAIAKLIGAPPGYVGYEQGGELARVINKAPSCVILLDEIEKAHPDIYNILLQAFDNAQVTTSDGEKINFKNTLFLMTSNAGSRELKTKSLGLVGGDSVQVSKSNNTINSIFSPEFRGRLDGIVQFNDLGKNHFISIVDKAITNLKLNNLNNLGITLEISMEAKQYFVNKFVNHTYGGRALENNVRKVLKKELSKHILSGDIKKGKKKVTITLKNDELKYSFKK